MLKIKTRLRWILAIGIALALSPNAQAENFMVTTQGNSFVPANLTIDTGDSVTFTNGGGLHNVSSDNGGFRCANGCDGQGGNGAPSSANWSFMITFNQVGTIDYECEVHAGLGMVGSIVVEAGGGGGGGGGGGETPGTLQLGSNSKTVSESAGMARIQVTRTGGDDGQVTADYSTLPGTATADLDYTPISGTLTWADGNDNPKNLDIPILDDTTTEANETLQLQLSNPTGGATLGSPTTATVTIADDDAAPSVCVEDEFTLCLNQDRFQVQIDWVDFASGTGRGHGIPYTSDSGFFWFFAEANLEVLIKVLDACNSEFESFWVFFAVASNVEYTITVTDTQEGVSKVYTNELGFFAPFTGDTAAFHTCP
jgi:plastocyanin